ncbi:GGDEF domain-containing protein [Streptomyces sp. NK08204]|uniref:GGDEF domain-containing protein n=1 Tax=Streptomyces sp. NK08204 TaxID=2873260 RepID=UPI001CEC35B1|nr:GGDEF domain-containing protein [Streptomyces sp. NK08204]
MHSWTDTLRFAFQPVVNLRTSTVAALETLARPETGDVLAEARRDPELDARLTVLALRAATRTKTLLPLHLNVFAATLADLGGLTPLHDAVRAAGRLPWEVTLDIVPPYTHVPQRALLEAVTTLRAQGFRISADGVGEGDVPLRLLTDLSPDLVKLDASLLTRPAAVRAMRTLCEQLGALVAVEGVETELQCAAAVSAGAQLAQGELLAPAARIPAADVYVPSGSGGSVAAAPRSGPSVREFVRPAAVLPATASAGQVRALLTGSPDVSGVLLVDQAGAPLRSVHRSRFLLSMSGRYGHALYADRPAFKLGDAPRTVGVDATAWEVLDVVAVGGRDRTSDDVAVVDRHGRCVGVVRLADLVRALAESRVEEAAGLNPLTRLPGSQAITDEADRRIADGRPFALSWLDIDHFKQVNDGAGFAAGDELIRSVGRALQEAVPGHARVGHIGGDDFLVLADEEALDALVAAVLDAPWSAGGRPVTLSLATVVCAPGSVADHRQAAAHLAPLKKAAKALDGAGWVLGRAGLPGHEVRRGSGTAPARAGYAAAEPGG